MLRTHTCGELSLGQVNQDVVLCGWVQRVRDKGGMIWLDLRDRYGITQLLFEEGKTPAAVLETARSLGREFVISAKGPSHRTPGQKRQDRNRRHRDPRGGAQHPEPC
jgi:aspartyl-tRNA synthetase